MKFGVKNKREINWAKEGCKILVKKGDNQGGKNGGEIEIPKKYYSTYGW